MIEEASNRLWPLVYSWIHITVYLCPNFASPCVIPFLGTVNGCSER